jgi:hypothetical protein
MPILNGDEQLQPYCLGQNDCSTSFNIKYIGQIKQFIKKTALIFCNYAQNAPLTNTLQTPHPRLGGGISPRRHTGRDNELIMPEIIFN